MNAKELRQTALNMLSRREHSRQEISQKLTAKADDASVLSLVLNDLQTEHLQSDERFAESYVRMRANRGYGPLRIRQELREKGLSAELIEVALNDGAYDWQQMAQEVYFKKFGRKIRLDAKEHNQCLRFMLYRGFSGEQIKRVFKAAG